MAIEFEPFMKVALEEARRSLREGNLGFGAVILRGKAILAQAHDGEGTEQGPTSHAELNAIRTASSRVGKDLSGTVLISTHEPCPTCAQAILRARIPHLVYGHGEAAAVRRGSERGEIPAAEIFRSAAARLRVEKGPLQRECAMLYNQEVRRELERLRGASDEQLRAHDRALAARRVEWYREQGARLSLGAEDGVKRGYRLLLRKLGVREAEAPIVRQEAGRILFHSRNFCPTLQACIILGLDTRKVCGLYNEGAADQLIRQIDPNLRFSRNYENLRPHADYCEERIEIRAE